MATFGVFSDAVYNPIYILSAAQYKSTAQASGTLVAANLAGASECYVASSGATALTTDTAANIVAQVQLAIATALQATGNSYTPASVVGLTWDVQVNNSNAGTLTLTAGTGVTITGTATIATVNSRQYLVTINTPTTVTFQNVGGGAWA